MAAMSLNAAGSGIAQKQQRSFAKWGHCLIKSSELCGREHRAAEGASSLIGGRVSPGSTLQRCPAEILIEGLSSSCLDFPGMAALLGMQELPTVQC